MTWGCVGGAVIIVGSLVALPAAVIAGDISPVGIGLRDVGGRLTQGSLGLIALGAAVLSFAGPEPLHGRAVRIGAAALALGLAGVAISTIVPIPAGSNSLESWPYIVSAGVGLGAAALGVLMMSISLVRASGPSRLVGLVLLAGPLLLGFGAYLNLGLLVSAAPVVAALGLAGIGVLAASRERAILNASD